MFLTPTVCLYKLLKYAGVSRASWYYYKRVKTIDKRIQNKGRKPPGHTLNRNDTIVRDEEIIFILKQYRNQIEFHNGGGYQMSSNIFYKYLQKLANNLYHEFIPPATPNKNAHVESFFSILEIEFMQTRYFHSMAEAYEQTQDFIQFYNERRIHKSLNYRTPNGILLDFKNGKTLSIKPVSLHHTRVHGAPRASLCTKRYGRIGQI